MSLVILFEFRAQPAGLDPDDCVGSGVKGRRPVKHFHSKNGFLEGVGVALDGLFDREAQKARHTV